MTAIDLFAGLGGTSEGARMAGVHVAWAANHWPLAVEWHTRNHPGTIHACQDLHQADFRDAPPHDLLLASPSCQGHSPARGKDRPHHDAQRATAWAVVTCVEVHKPAAVIVENVPAFTSWTLFPAWSQAMRALGYGLTWNVLDAADCGVPQERNRVFVLALRGRRGRLMPELRIPELPWVPVRSVLDLDAGKWAPVAGHCAATLARVAAGRQTFGDSFVMPYYGGGSGLTGRSLDRPLGTLTTKSRWAVVQGDAMRMLTVGECRAAMGFPVGYVLPRNCADAHKLIGNAVPPPLAAAVIRAAMEAA